MPAGVVYVGRPSVFGNPFHLWIDCDAVQMFRWWLTGVEGRAELRDRLAWKKQPAVADAKIDKLMEQRTRLLNAIHTIRSRDLACWCPLDKPCHADVLLEIANGVQTQK